jgi:hypothetical protein
MLLAEVPWQPGPGFKDVPVKIASDTDTRTDAHVRIYT